MFWPCKTLGVGDSGQIVLFQLTLYDAGDAAAKKYGHIRPVRERN